MDWSDPKTRKILVTAGAILVLVAASWALASFGTGTDAELGLSDANGPQGAAGSGDALDSENVLLATDADGDPVGGGQGDSEGGSGDVPVPPGSGTGDTGDDPDGDADGGADAPADDPADPASTMTVMILFWNDTDATAPSGAEVVIAGKSWKPNTNGESDAGSLSGLPFGKEIVLEVYPDGRGGEKLTVPVTFTSDMKPDSEQDAIHVEISDSKVRVLGNAVNNFDVAFDRF